jgi:hypothetical protein
MHKERFQVPKERDAEEGEIQKNFRSSRVAKSYIHFYNGKFADYSLPQRLADTVLPALIQMVTPSLSVANKS